MGKATPEKPWAPALFPKQQDVYNLRTRFNLISGPRLSGKTTGVLHRIVRHAWEVDNSRFAMFAKTIGNATSAGIWKDLNNYIIREWIDARVSSPFAEFGYTVEPKVDGSSRLHYLKLRNYWGGESEIQLYSLDHDSKAEDKLMSTSYSGIYFSELQMFEDPDIFNVSTAQLRMREVPKEEYIWIADTNPPESGPAHFAYKLFFIDPHIKDHPNPKIQKMFKLVEFTVDDNLSPDAQEEIDILKNNYREDPAKWDRFILGKWVEWGRAEHHFKRFFNHNVHIVGNAKDPDEDNWTYLNPTNDCKKIVCGWDPGDVNHSWHALERVINEYDQSEWRVLEEEVSVKEEVTIEEFAMRVKVKRSRLKKMIGRDVEIVDWCDTNAWDPESAGTDEMDYKIIEQIFDGEIVMQSARNAKGRGSIQRRVELVQQLLNQRRLLVSAHCVKTIAMFENLKKGKKEKKFIAQGQPEKHPFDSLSYALYSEMLDDIEDLPDTQSVGRRVISIRG
jgi:hypothetical protein